MSIAAASVIGAVGIFLPWATGSAYGISVTVDGTGGDGWIVLALFAVSVVLAAINIKKEPAMGYKIGITAASAIAAIIATVKIINTFGADYVTAGIGLYLILIFGVVVAILPWLPINKKQAY